MQRLRSLVLSLAALLAVSAVVAAAAQAIPQVSAASFPVSTEAEGGAGVLHAGSNAVACEKNTANGEIAEESAKKGNLGTVKLTWVGCTSAGAKCKSEEEAGADSRKGAAGEVIVEVPVHLVLLNSGPGMNSLQLYYLYFLVLKIVVKCGVIRVIIKGDPAPEGESTLGGGLALLTLEEGVKSGRATLEGKGVEGRQEVTSCEEPTELCSGQTIELLSEFVEGKLEATYLEQTDTIRFSPEVTAEN